MQTIQITANFAQLLETNSWVIVNRNYVVDAYKSRQAARDAKAAQGLEGSIKNKSEINFEVFGAQAENKQPASNEVVAQKQAAPVAAPVVKDEAKQITHVSTVERPCKAVWAIADSMKGQKRSVILAACVAQGIAYYTARTQYQQWLGIQKEMAEREAQQAAGALPKAI